MIQYITRSNFDNNIKNNGQYKVKGFTEEIVEKYEKIKLIRKKDKNDKKMIINKII